MKMVITIDDDIYDDYLKQGATLPKYGTAINSLYKALWNGVPLPKGHGDLIDYGDVVDVIDDWVNAEEYRYTNATDYLRKRIENVPTIIEGSDTE